MRHLELGRALNGKEEALYTAGLLIHWAQLYLNNNYIGDAGAVALAQALAANCTLTTVCYVPPENAAGTGVGVARAEGFSNSTRLLLGSAQLFLAHNDIGNVGATKLARALAASRTLKEVSPRACALLATSMPIPSCMPTTIGPFCIPSLCSWPYRGTP